MKQTHQSLQRTQSTHPWSVTLLLVLEIVIGPISGFAREFEIGPRQPLKEISQVPWESLAPGDHVKIHWREDPYAEKWVLCCQGTSSTPITISGVLGPQGQRPVIDGRNATTRSALNYWGEERGVLKIGGANRPADRMPSHIVVENLEIQNGLKSLPFSGRKGTGVYSKDAAGVIVEKASHLTLRNLVIHDCSNGLMVSPQSSNIIVEYCYFFDNGNPNTVTEHNVYTEANGMTFQFNRFGPLRQGCRGNNLKDRSAGLVVRYNWIEGGNRQLDLVDSTGNPKIVASSAYRQTWVYGNTLIEREGDGNNQIVHYGGDSGNTATYRKGTLFFFHNTIISARSTPTMIFRLSSSGESVDCRNNIFYATVKGAEISLTYTTGDLTVGRNWLSRGWILSPDHHEGNFVGKENLISGDDPGFESLEQGDFSLKGTSACLQEGEVLAPEIKATHPLLWRYVKHQRSSERDPDEAAIHLGGY
tara:strand:+ start:653 stop:2077 length:1425 start_codon:yes stop_codon:yes gene_type:complete